MTTPAEGNNTQRRSKRILNWLYDFVESYGLDFFSVVIAGTGLLLYEAPLRDFFGHYSGSNR